MNRLIIVFMGIYIGVIIYARMINQFEWLKGAAFTIFIYLIIGYISIYKRDIKEKQKNSHLLLVLMLFNFFPANDVTLSVCRHGNHYQFSYTADNLAGYWFNNATNADLEKLTSSNEGAEFVLYTTDGTTQSIFAASDTPRCKNEWKPDAPSIPIEMKSDCANVEIIDQWGNWHRVQSNGVDVMLQYGESLTGSNGQSTNSADYRAIPIDCY